MCPIPMAVRIVPLLPSLVLRMLGRLFRPLGLLSCWTIGNINWEEETKWNHCIFLYWGIYIRSPSVLPVTCALRAFSIQHVLWFLTRWLRSVGGPGLNSLTPYSTSSPCVLECNSTNSRPSRAPWSPIEIIDEHRRQTNRQTDRQTDRRTDGRTDRQTESCDSKAQSWISRLPYRAWVESLTWDLR